nr:pentatricopeptide repeat-containing protein At3g42630 isoform X2 [Tanacetum cinerariifolium]
MSSKGSKPALSISKKKPAYYPDVVLEKMVSDQMWIEEECKYDIAAMYGISHWWFQRQRFYIDRYTFEGDCRAVRTHMWILSVVRIEFFSMYGYDYMKNIVLRRVDLNEHIITKRDFKYLYPSDFEDLHLVIRQRIEDFQLGIKSYQTQLNLTKPRWDATGFKYNHDFMINEALDYQVKEFKVNRMNLSLNTRFWKRKDIDRSKEFMFAIQKWLKTRRIFRNLESFVGGRLSQDETDNNSEVSQENIKPKRSKRAKVTKDFGPDYMTYIVNEEPQTYKAVMESSESPYWKEAIHNQEIYMKQPEGFVVKGQEHKASLQVAMYSHLEGLMYHGNHLNNCEYQINYGRKFVALDKATEEAEWLRSFLEGIPLWPKPMTDVCIHCDSMAALTRVKNHIYNGKSRHIRHRHNTIKDLLRTGIISIDYVKSKENSVDPLTKGLCTKQVIFTSRLKYYEIFLIGITYTRLMCGRIFGNQMAKFSKILMNKDMFTTELNTASMQREFINMVEAGFYPDLIAFNIRAAAFSKMSLFWDLHLSLEHMNHNGIFPDLVTYGCVIDVYLDRKLGRNLDFALRKINVKDSPVVMTDQIVLDVLGKGDFHSSSRHFWNLRGRRNGLIWN